MISWATNRGNNKPCLGFSGPLWSPVSSVAPSLKHCVWDTKRRRVCHHPGDFQHVQALLWDPAGPQVKQTVGPSSTRHRSTARWFIPELLPPLFPNHINLCRRLKRCSSDEWLNKPECALKYYYRYNKYTDIILLHCSLYNSSLSEAAISTEDTSRSAGDDIKAHPS